MGDARQIQRCGKCFETFKSSKGIFQLQNMTLFEARRRYEKTKSPSYAHALVRIHCNMLFKHLRHQKCAVCDYEKHIELCHIRGIASFPETASFSEINAPENIIGLCPNHHWELDNGHLTL